MRHHRTLSTLLLTGTLALAGCGSEASEEAAPAAEPAPEPVAEMAGAPECVLQNATPEEAAARPSPLHDFEIAVGGHAGRLCWGAPSANGRTVMGGLVPYGAPWRMGANEPTTLHLTGPAQLGGAVTLEPGSYSLYAVPGEGEWQIFVNSNTGRWGIPISPDVRASEVGSFMVTPATIEAPVETLTYRWEPNAEGTMGDIVMEWESTQIRFHVHPVM